MLKKEKKKNKTKQQKFKKNKALRQFVIKFVENRDPYDPSEYVRSMFWVEENKEWTDNLQEGTRYIKDAGSKYLSKLLDDHKMVGELVDVTDPYKCSIKLGTILIDINNTSLMICRIPQISCDTLELVGYSSEAGEIREEMTLKNFVNKVQSELLMVVWDSAYGAGQKKVSQSNNNDYLISNNFYTLI